jgi:hypothetical protein
MQELITSIITWLRQNITLSIITGKYMKMQWTSMIFASNIELFKNIHLNVTKWIGFVWCIRNNRSFHRLSHASRDTVAQVSAIVIMCGTFDVPAWVASIDGFIFCIERVSNNMNQWYMSRLRSNEYWHRQSNYGHRTINEQS